MQTQLGAKTYLAAFSAFAIHQCTEAHIPTAKVTGGNRLANIVSPLNIFIHSVVKIENST